MTVDLSELEPSIAQVAGKYGAMYRKYGAEADDFAQELRLWALERQDYITVLLDPEQTDPKYGMKRLLDALENEAKDYAVDIKAQSLGYKREDLYWYGRNELKALLPAMFDPESRHNPPQMEEGARGKRPAQEGNNWLATLADVSRAYEKLDPEDQLLLRGFHLHGWSNKELAAEYQVSEQMMSYYHSRALNRLLRNAGGAAPRPMRSAAKKDDPWRGRHAVSNAAARAAAINTWDGDEYASEGGWMS